MNEIEKAIAYFEEACKESDEIIDECSEDLKAELLEQKAHFVTAMAALREKQENDRLKAEGRVVVPCRVGDLLYTLYYDSDFPEEAIVEELKVLEVSTARIWVDSNYFDYDDIGKTVFLTKEDAEKALKERNEHGI